MEFTDEQYMRKAIGLALKGCGQVSPNPLVGSLVIKNGKIIGHGYHKKAGTPHAEINALRMAGTEAKDSTFYITLEPCNHWGRTPPCTEAIILAGIKKVVVATQDPNSLVNGKGIRKLQEAGLEVIVGCLEKEVQKINESYSKYITTGIPFVTAKVAVSLDGKIATSKGLSKWITNEKARNFSHELRCQSDAILVGKKTIIHDNPELTARKNNKVVKNPFRIILDTDLSLPLSSSVIQNNSDQKTLIATGSQSNSPKAEKLQEKVVKILYLPSQNGKVSLQALLQKLGKMQITNVLVEGGSETLTSFLKEKLIDKFYFFIAPKIIGKEGISSFGNLGIADLQAAYNLQQVAVKKLDDNVVISGYLRKT